MLARRAGHGDTTGTQAHRSGAALWSEHHDRWRLVGVLAREDQLAVVLAALIRRILWARDHEVPFKDVAGSASKWGVRHEEPRALAPGLGERSLGLGHDVRHWLLTKPLVLLLQPGQASLGRATHDLATFVQTHRRGATHDVTKLCRVCAAARPHLRSASFAPPRQGTGARTK